MKKRHFILGLTSAIAMIPLAGLMGGWSAGTNINTFKNKTNLVNDVDKVTFGITNEGVGHMFSLSGSEWGSDKKDSDHTFSISPKSEYGKTPTMPTRLEFGDGTEISRLYWNAEAKFDEGMASNYVLIHVSHLIWDQAAQSTDAKIRVRLEGRGYTDTEVTVISTNPYSTIDNNIGYWYAEYDTRITANDGWWFQDISGSHPVIIQTGNEKLRYGEDFTLSEPIRDDDGHVKSYHLHINEGQIRGSVFINANVTNNDPKVEGKALTIYFGNQTKYVTIDNAIRQDISKFPTYEFNLPNDIIDHHKVIDEVASQEHLKYLIEDGSSTPLSANYVDSNTVKIDFSKSKKTTLDGNVSVFIPLCPSSTENSWENDSWSDFIYWFKLAKKSQGDINSNTFLDDFARMYGLSSASAMIGLERTVTWDSMPHKVKLVNLKADETNSKQIHYVLSPENVNYDILYHQLPSQNDDTREDVSSETVDMVFQFSNLLTNNSGGAVTSKWHANTGLSSDDDYNCWIGDFAPWEHQGEKASVGETSRLYDFLTNQTKFIDKFADTELLEAIRPTAILRTTTGRLNKGYGDIAFLKTKFFLPTAVEMGMEPNEIGFDISYECDNDGSLLVSPFQYWANNAHGAKPEDYIFKCVNSDKGHDYWICTPSISGSGLGKTEDLAYVKDNGSWDHEDMDHAEGILPCFCI